VHRWTIQPGTARHRPHHGHRRYRARYDASMVLRSGIIRAGPHAGWRVRIERQPKDDCLVLAESPDGSAGFDDWLASADELPAYLDERQWIVDWDRDPE
jgi:hypothetical protein